MNVETAQEKDTSCNSDGAQSDSNGKFYKVNKELFVSVKQLPDSVLHKYISKVSISDDTEDKDTGGMKLWDRPKSKHMEACHPRNVKRLDSYTNMLASDTDNTDQDTKPKCKVKPCPSFEPSSSRQWSQRIIEKNCVQRNTSDMISSNSEPEDHDDNDAYNADTEGEVEAPDDEPAEPKRGKLTVAHHGLKKTKVSMTF